MCVKLETVQHLSVYFNCVYCHEIDLRSINVDNNDVCMKLSDLQLSSQSTLETRCMASTAVRELQSETGLNNSSKT